MGKFSRDKGRRNEYLLRDHLRRLGFDAVRVPLSGASEGFKGDVIAKKDGLVYSFELKSRQDNFKLIYQLYDMNKEDGVLRLYYPDTEETVVLSTDFTTFELIDKYEILPIYRFTTSPTILNTKPRTFEKLRNLKMLKEDSDFLVVKDNNKPLLFIKYS